MLIIHFYSIIIFCVINFCERKQTFPHSNLKINFKSLLQSDKKKPINSEVFLRDSGGKNAKTNSRVTIWTKTRPIYFI